MTFGFLAITTLHIILLAVCAFLIALLILLFAIFSGRKKKHEDENPDDVSLKTPSATAQEPSEAQPQDASASAAAAPPASAPFAISVISVTFGVNFMITGCFAIFLI